MWNGWIEAAIQDSTTEVTVHLDSADFADLSWLMDMAINILK